MKIKKIALFSLVMAFNASTAMAANVPSLANTTHSMMCITNSVSNWQAHNLGGGASAWPENPNYEISSVRYIIRANNTGDCSDKNPYLGTVELGFERGALTRKNLWVNPERKDIYFAVDPKHVSHCGAREGAPVNCFGFVIGKQ
ncbi:MAG: hypothetical protein ACNA7Y_03970 [Gammaproteobacteria bacterium]